jgi:hypothetical protein
MSDKPKITPTAPIVKTPVAPVVPVAKGVVPPVPKGIPPVPKIKAPPLITKTVAPPKDSSKKELTLQEEIEKGVTLKKVTTVDKTGIDYIKKRSIKQVGDSNGESDCINSNNHPQETSTKGNMFDEMRRIQLKKINK